MISRFFFLLYPWTCVFLFAYPVLWTLLISPELPYSGMKAYTNLWIGGGPTLMLALASALLISFSRLQNIPRLFTLAGATYVVGLILAFFVSFTGIALLGCGTALFGLGQYVLKRLEASSNSSFDRDAQVRRST